jgi:uncharacterized protein YlaI
MGADAAAHAVVDEWLGTIRRARELPARSKVCKRCGTDVALDTFRQKVGGAYLCSDCVDKAERRLERRVGLMRRFLVFFILLVVATGITAGAVAFGPKLLEPRKATRR